MEAQNPTYTIRPWLFLGMALLGCAHNPAASRMQSTVTAEEIRWLADDYPGALRQAVAARKPILIEMWAPWCHSCLSMKQFILKDPGLRAFAARFVWLAIDTEREVNAPLLEKFPVQAWPTFLVVSPVDESVQAVHVGSESVGQFRELLADGESGHLDALARGKLLAPDDPLRWVREGDRLSLAGDPGGAAQAYGRALAEASSDWPRRAELISRSIYLLYLAGRHADCVQGALDQLGGLSSGPSAVDALATACECADALPPGDARAERFRQDAIALLRALKGDLAAPLSADDRSEAYRVLREILERRGELESARQVALEQYDFLEKAARQADSPLSASTYNWARAEVAVYLGRGEQILPVLEASARALPDQYDPPFRLAWVHWRLGQGVAALAAARRALALCPGGPRKARIFGLLADIHRALNDPAQELSARSEALGIYRTLPKGQRRPIEEKKAQEAVDALLTPQDAGGSPR